MSVSFNPKIQSWLDRQLHTSRQWCKPLQLWEEKYQCLLKIKFVHWCIKKTVPYYSTLQDSTFTSPHLSWERPAPGNKIQFAGQPHVVCFKSWEQRNSGLKAKGARNDHIEQVSILESNTSCKFESMGRRSHVAPAASKFCPSDWNRWILWFQQVVLAVNAISNYERLMLKFLQWMEI